VDPDSIVVLISLLKSALFKCTDIHSFIPYRCTVYLNLWTMVVTLLNVRKRPGL